MTVSVQFMIWLSFTISTAVSVKSTAEHNNSAAGLTILSFNQSQGSTSVIGYDAQFVFNGFTCHHFGIYPNGCIVVVCYLAVINRFLCPYFHDFLNYPIAVYYNIVNDTTDLSLLTTKIRAAYPADNKFQVTTAYSFTWFDPNSTFYQVVLCTDMTSLFMIVSYVKLTYATVFYCSNNCYNYLNASTTGSNCGVPGQFIFSYKQSI